MVQLLWRIDFVDSRSSCRFSRSSVWTAIHVRIRKLKCSLSGFSCRARRRL